MKLWDVLLALKKTSEEECPKKAIEYPCVESISHATVVGYVKGKEENSPRYVLSAAAVSRISV